MTAAFCTPMQGLVQDLSPIASVDFLTNNSRAMTAHAMKAGSAMGWRLAAAARLARRRSGHEKAKNILSRCRESSRRMLKVSQVAERLNCSISTVYSLVESGKLGHHRCPGIRVSEGQLTAFLEGTKQEQGPVSLTRSTGPRPRLKHITI